ncbi:hypothetical protein IKN40_07065 [bacterium]|nr:hypothetical protein [bacterium]
METFFTILFNILSFAFGCCIGLLCIKIYNACNDIKAIRNFIESDKNINLTIK